MKELVLKKCLKCKAVIEVLEDKGCETFCCGEEMKKIIPNSVDAAIEKHVPNYEVNDNKILVKVNHVMEDNHYIEWIAICSDNKTCKRFFKPGEIAEAKFEYIPGSIIYAYCNTHGLWSKVVE